jgi:hypothetical protein
VRDDLKPYVGVRQGGEPEDELQHFYQCKACGQPVDMRDLAAVFHHEDEGHEPLPEDEAMRLLSIEDRFRLKLMMETVGRA